MHTNTHEQRGVTRDIAKNFRKVGKLSVVGGATHTTMAALSMILDGATSSQLADDTLGDHGDSVYSIATAQYWKGTNQGEQPDFLQGRTAEFWRRPRADCLQSTTHFVVEKTTIKEKR